MLCQKKLPSVLEEHDSCWRGPADLHQDCLITDDLTSGLLDAVSAIIPLGGTNLCYG